MFVMESRIETVSYAVFHYIRNEFFILIAVLALLIAVTAAFVIHEIRHDIS